MLWRIPADAHGQRIGTMARRGPFTTYKPEYCGLARNFCLLGATNAELARMFEVAESTIGKVGCLPEDRDLAADATLRDGGSPHRGADAWTEEEGGLTMLTDNAALLSSFGKRKSKKPLDRTEQCCGVSLPTLT
jgi:hypothetical protein